MWQAFCGLCNISTGNIQYPPSVIKYRGSGMISVSRDKGKINVSSVFSGTTESDQFPSIDSNCVN